MRMLEPAIALGLAAAALFAGGDDSGWLLVIAAVLAVAIRRWEAYAVGLPGAAAVAAGVAAEGLRWHLAVAAASLIAGTALVLRRRLPDEGLDATRALLALLGAAFVAGAGWLPFLALERLAAYRDGAVVAMAAVALVLAATNATAAFRTRSGKMEDPAPAGGAEPSA